MTVPEEEEEQAKDGAEKEEDLSVPGSSYIKLLALTPSAVLPGMASACPHALSTTSTRTGLIAHMVFAC